MNVFILKNILYTISRNSSNNFCDRLMSDARLMYEDCIIVCHWQFSQTKNNYKFPKNYFL